MKKMKTLMVITVLMYSFTANAAVKYFNAKVQRIEVCKNSTGVVFITFRDIVGTTPPITNGCSNDVINPYVRLNSTPGELTEFEKLMYATFLTAQSQDRTVRVRFDDEDPNNAVVSVALD